ncbi:MAG: translation initiation factor IF-2 subunit gamma [archaeon]
MVKASNTEKELDILNVGIVGHIDHGKTTLLQKISGKWTDTHSEELKRGITIKLGYADIIIYEDKGNFNRTSGNPVRKVSFVDSPGHEMLMATMLSGAAIIDAAILVVAANEGIKPQTREHLMALQAKKIKNLIVIQNKIDLVTKEQATKNYNEIKTLLKGKYDSAPIVPISAQQEVNIDEIYRAIMEVPIPQRNESGTPIFLIARSFDINKPGKSPEKLNGAVLGGTLKQGTLKVGDEIEIKPGRVIKEANQYSYKTINTKILKLFNGSKEVQSLTPGGSMSIETSLDMALGKNDTLSGCVASLKGKLPEITTSIKVKHALFPEIFTSQMPTKVEAIKPSEMLMLSINTSMTVGMVKRINKDEMEFTLKIPIVPQKGDNFGIARNINNHWRLIGYGEVL